MQAIFRGNGLCVLSLAKRYRLLPRLRVSVRNYWPATAPASGIQYHDASFVSHLRLPQSANCTRTWSLRTLVQLLRLAVEAIRPLAPSRRRPSNPEPPPLAPTRSPLRSVKKPKLVSLSDQVMRPGAGIPTAASAPISPGTARPWESTKCSRRLGRTDSEPIMWQ